MTEDDITAVDVPRGRWQPILRGALAARALEAVDAIARHLRDDPFPPWQPAAPELGPSDRHASLAFGRAGLAVFYAYLARSRAERGDEEVAASLLAGAVAAESPPESSLSLYMGSTGVAWATAHLHSRAGVELRRSVDARVQSHLETSRGWEAYDLIFGLVGLGVYALERLPDPAAAACLEGVVGRLNELAERRPEGVSWPTVPGLLPPRQRKAVRDYYDLGVAHGVPGVIALLARACATDAATARTRPLLQGAVAWLLAQRLPERAASRFPPWLVPGVEPRTTTLAWCYGDLGVAAVLLLAARCAGEPAWEREALRLARATANRLPDASDVLDARLCHGAAGIGHLFNRMYQEATDESWLEGAAVAWFERALALRRPQEKFAGFSAVRAPRGGTRKRVAHRGLLLGAAGIGLALLAAATDVEPTWDRLLLLS